MNTENNSQDLFNEYGKPNSNLPAELTAILDKYQDGEDYEACRLMLLECEAIGYTFDYYLDAIPANLRKIEPSIELTRVKSDINGNPRYACHFLNLLKPFEGQFKTLVNKDGSTMTPNEVCNYLNGVDIITHRYNLALKRARTIGGRKYDTKSYGGGIVFQSYNISDLEKSIKALVNN